MTLICEDFLASAFACQSELHVETRALWDDSAHGGSNRLLLLAYECHVKTKFHVDGDAYARSSEIA